MDQSSLETKDRIIFIGLSKMGTTSLHKLLSDSGIRSVHWKMPAEPVFLAEKIFSNFSAGKRLLEGVGNYQAYSELSFVSQRIYLEASVLFRELHRDYPHSYFILNTRSKDKWISSRLNHFSRYGMLANRAKKALNVDTDEELVELWSRFYDEHHGSVRSFFRQNSGKFLEFNIERDPPEKIADFLNPTYAVDIEKWGVHNSTNAKNRRKAKRRARPSA